MGNKCHVFPRFRHSAVFEASFQTMIRLETRLSSILPHQVLSTCTYIVHYSIVLCFQAMHESNLQTENITFSLHLIIYKQKAADGAAFASTNTSILCRPYPLCRLSAGIQLLLVVLTSICCLRRFLLVIVTFCFRSGNQLFKVFRLHRTDVIIVCWREAIEGRSCCHGVSAFTKRPAGEKNGVSEDIKLVVVKPHFLCLQWTYPCSGSKASRQSSISGATRIGQ